MRSANMAKNCPNAVRLPKCEPVIVVAEKDYGKRVTATFRAGVILRIRRQRAAWSLTEGHTLFCQITPF